jgi:hypothetical protein
MCLLGLSDSLPEEEVSICRLRMFEHEVLRRMFRNTREEVDQQESGQISTVRSSIFCTLGRVLVR